MQLVRIHDPEVVCSAELRERAARIGLTKYRMRFVAQGDAGDEVAFLSFDIYPNRDFLVLYELWVANEHRGQRVGAQALEQALRVTREKGRCRLLVLPKPIDDGMTEADLRAWYARRGFVPWPEQDGVLQREL